MIRKSLVVAGLLFGGVNAVAQNEYFVGAGIGNGSWTPKATATRVSDGASATITDSDSGGFISVLGGTIIDNKHKLTVNYTTYNTDDGVDMSSIDLGYSYLLDQDNLEITNHKWKPFVGMNYLVGNYREDLDDDWNKSEAKITFKALMVGIGADYEIDKKQFITMQYNMSLSVSGSEQAIYTYDDEDYNTDMEVDEVSRWLISYNYKF